MRWHELAQQLGSYSVWKNLGPQRELLQGPDRPITMAWNICGPRWWHTISGSTNWPNSCHSICKNLGAWWLFLHGKGRLTNDHATAHLWAKMVPYNLRWCKLAQWLWSYNLCKNLGAHWEFPQGPDGSMPMPRQFFSPPSAIGKGRGQKSCGQTGIETEIYTHGWLDGWTDLHMCIRMYRQRQTEEGHMDWWKDKHERMDGWTERQTAAPYICTDRDRQKAEGRTDRQMWTNRWMDRGQTVVPYHNTTCDRCIKLMYICLFRQPNRWTEDRHTGRWTDEQTGRRERMDGWMDRKTDSSAIP